MKRTKLIDRLLPDYTNGEEVFNMVSHIVGGGLGVFYLVSCVIVSALHHNIWGIVSSAIYGASVIALFTMSSVYHGVKPCMAKKVLQVLDHCTIYFMIAGTYTPILLSLLRKTDPVIAWVIFGVVWGVAALAITFTAIDLKKYKKFYINLFPKFCSKCQRIFTHSRLTNCLNFVIILIETNER